MIDENDKTVIGNAQPKFYGGLNNSFTYKGFDLSIFLTFSYGNEVLNATKLVTSKVGSSRFVRVTFDATKIENLNVNETKPFVRNIKA